MPRGGVNSKISVSLDSFSGPLFPAAFILLYLYLTIYNIYQVFSPGGANDKDEDFVNCTCEDGHKKFYRGLFWGFTSIWIILVLLWKLICLADCCKLYVLCCCTYKYLYSYVATTHINSYGYTMYLHV